MNRRLTILVELFNNQYHSVTLHENAPSQHYCSHFYGKHLHKPPGTRRSCPDFCEDSPTTRGDRFQKRACTC